MDCDLYPDGWHPMKPGRNREHTGPSKQAYTRTQRPPRYLWIDFGLSVHFKDPDHPPTYYRNPGTDKTVPEFKDRAGDTTLYDPFATDIYYLGNLVRKYFLDVSYSPFVQKPNADKFCVGRSLLPHHQGL